MRKLDSTLSLTVCKEKVTLRYARDREEELMIDSVSERI